MLSHCWIFLSWCCIHDSWRFIRLYPSFQRQFEQLVKPSRVSQELQHVWLGEAWWIPYPIEKKELRLGTYRKSRRIWYNLSLSLSLPMPIAVSWHYGYSKMDFSIHHDICAKEVTSMSPGSPAWVILALPLWRLLRPPSAAGSPDQLTNSITVSVRNRDVMNRMPTSGILGNCHAACALFFGRS